MRSGQRGAAHTPVFPDAWDGRAGGADPARTGAPVRPACPPTLVLLGCSWAGVCAAQGAWAAWLADGACWMGVDPRVVAGALCLAASAVAVMVGAAVRPVLGLALLAVLGLCTGGAAGSLHASATALQAVEVPLAAVGSCTFRVESDPQWSEATGMWHFEAVVAEGESQGARVWVEVPATEAGPCARGVGFIGSLVALTGGWVAVDAGDEFGATLFARGMAVRVKASSCVAVGFQGGPVGAVRWARARILEAVDPFRDEGRALIAGVVCGMRSALGTFEIDDVFADLGLSHLVAVSGSHLAVVAALAASLLGRVRARPAARCAATTALLAVYVAFTGFQPSAIRSWCMASLAAAATVAGRRAHGVSAVALAATAMLLTAPSCAATMGFTLSVLSVLGLTLFATYAQAWTACLLPAKAPEGVVGSLALTSVAQVFTLPVTLPAFGTLPLLAPLANVVAGPLVSVLLVTGLVGSGVAGIAAPWADAALMPCDAVAALTVRWAHALAALPVVVVSLQVAPKAAALVMAGVVVAIYLLWPPPSRVFAGRVCAVALIAGAMLFVRWRFFAPARMVVLDVGQGDAILIQDGAHAVLIDAGPDDAVCFALARNCVFALDAVLITHTDLDHAGGLRELDGHVAVGNVLVARGVAAAMVADAPELDEAIVGLSGTVAREVGIGDEVSVGRFTMRIVWPDGPVEGDDNEESLVGVLTFEDADVTFSALLTGDAESAVVEPLIERGLVGAVDVLKVGHHGSAVSTTSAMLEALDPIIAVASAGEGNRYGHPTQECVACVEAHGTTTFLCTAEMGDISLTPAAGGVEVSCARGADVSAG